MCYCAECDTLGGKLMTEAELISHQRILCKTRMCIHKIADLANIQRSTTVAGLERQNFMLIRGTRVDRNISPTRAQSQLSNIKTDMQNWIDRAFSLCGEGIDLCEARSTLDSLTSVFTGIGCGVPSLESLSLRALTE